MPITQIPSAGVVSSGGGTSSYETVVIVTEAADFGTITNNVVVPDSTKTYFIDGAIDMGNVSIEVPTGGINIYSDDFNTKGIFSTESSHTMFVTPSGGYAGNVTLTDVFLASSGTSSEIFNLDNASNFSAVELNRVNLGNFGYGDTTSLGSFTDYLLLPS